MVILFGSFFIISVFFICIGVWLFKKFKKGCTQRVIGQLSRTTSHHRYNAPSLSQSNTYTSYYEYYYNGEMHEVRAHTTMGDIETEGGVEIFIDPNNPKKHYRKKDLLVPAFFFGLGLVMLCITLYYANLAFDFMFYIRYKIL